MSKFLTKTSEFLAVALGTIVASLLLGALLISTGKILQKIF